MNLVLILAVGVLLAIVIVAIVVLATSGRKKALEQRVLERMPETTLSETLLPRRDPAFRLREANTGQLRFIAPMLNMPVDLPLAHVVQPPVVFIGLVLPAALVAWGGHLLELSEYVNVILTVAAWIFMVRGFFGWELNRYRGRLFAQLPDTIQLVISSTRAGLPVSESFRTVVSEMPQPTSAEFAAVVDEMSVGVPADEALLNMHRRTGLTEYAILAVTIGVQARSGGRLAETIGNLADTVRERRAIMGKAQAVSAEAKTSALIMSLLTPITATLFYFLRPGYLNVLLNDPRGRNMLTVGVSMLAFGIFMMFQLIKGATRD